MRRIATALKTLASQETATTFVFPLHPNPSVREIFLPVLSDLPNVILLEPLDYFDMAKLLARVKLVISDSGGLQEEAPALGKPILVLREDTERPEGVAAGTADLVGCDPERIVRRTRELLHDQTAYQRMANAVNPYGDGQAAPRALAFVRQWLTSGGQPLEQGAKWNH